MFYDSRSLKHKTPFGAVAAGTAVTFHLRPPRAWGCARVHIHLIHELGCESFTFAAEWIGYEDGCDVFRLTLDTARLLGPVWYYFSWEADGGRGGFAGPAPGRESGVCGCYDSDPSVYQLTVYEKNDTPAWYGRGVTYHIFPDRFRRSRVPDPRGMVGERWVHKEWFDSPAYAPDAKGEVRNCDFFGGDLKGVMEKLPYLQSLGVATLYFSPIFEAASNHRYDTADYLTVDPMVGTEADFAELCRQAGERGIRVILDGVFNHTGFDSVYFNGRGTYPGPGAYQSESSPYSEWFEFQEWPEKYSSWWGIYTLPQVNESCPSYREFINSGDGSVVRKWLRLGAAGWRLDVADELPGPFIEELRCAVREECPDGVVIGEVWEDASHKIAYNVRRRYLLGRELDGVMNYPFRDAAIEFVLGGSSAEFAERMETIRENYPEPCFYSLMNALGTHDTPRILTVLGARPEDWEQSKKEKSKFSLPPDRYELAVKRLRVAAGILFAFPGSPTVYYGDEAGLEGFEDPFNRRGYPWGHENMGLVEWYTRLAKCRNTQEALQSGDIRYLPAMPQILAFRRSAGKRGHVTCLFNRGREDQEMLLPSGGALRDLLSGEVFEAGAGKALIKLPGYGVRYLAETDA
ncbi:MAG: glycoside hydrolase family 13 protein [Oscillospiraceae bacterium]|nr:glycoside hydrolase family 13 protein [Oscillospiraceae bacterium]